MPMVVGWILTAITSAFGWLMKNRLGQWLASILLWFGVSLATYEVGVEPFLQQLRSTAQAGMGGGEYAALALQWLGVLNLDKAITMIISAIAAKNGVQAGRVFFKKKAA